MPFYLNLALFILSIGIVSILLRKAGINLFLAQIFLTIFLMWTSMQIFRVSEEATKGVFKKPWIWPVITSLYQLTQVAVRLPFGKLSQKLKSRKAIIQICMVSMIIGLIMVTASNFSLWSIIIAAITGGLVGSSFGLLNQYWSENWDIKRVFFTVMIIFMIPIISSYFVNIIVHIPGIHLIENLENIRWLFIIGTIISSITFLAYSFLHKENKNSIRVNLSSKISFSSTLTQIKKVFFISIGSGCVAFAWEIQRNLVAEEWFNYVAMIVSVFAVLFTCLIKIQKVRYIYITSISATIALICFFINLIMLATGHINNTVLISTLLIGTYFSWTYIISYFGIALHFDHKNTLLALGVFLSIKSLFIGLGNLFAGEMLVYSNDGLDGLLIPMIVAAILLVLGIGVSCFMFKRHTSEIVEEIVSWEKANTKY